MFHTKITNRPTRSRNQLTVNFGRTAISNRILETHGSKFYNLIPHEIKSTSNRGRFKKELSNWLNSPEILNKILYDGTLI
jgi:hypothetical protein